MLQYPVVVFGAMRAGLIVVNTNPLYTAREMEHQFKLFAEAAQRMDAQRQKKQQA